NGCDARHSILDTGVRLDAVGQRTRRAPDPRATHPSSRPARSGPRPSRGSGGAMDAVTPRHGSAPALATVRASAGAVTPEGPTPRTTLGVSRTTAEPGNTQACAV